MTRKIRNWMTTTPRLGAMIGTPGRLASHVGWYVGRLGAIERAVVHNAKGYRAVVDPIEDFAPDGTYWVMRLAAPGAEATVIARALHLVKLGRPYHLFKNNCEHAATWAQLGRPQSPQLDGAVRLAALLGVIAVVANLDADEDEL